MKLGKGGQEEEDRGRLGLKGFCGVGSDGMSGGLALYWHESYVVEILDTN